MIAVATNSTEEVLIPNHALKVYRILEKLGHAPKILHVSLLDPTENFGYAYPEEDTHDWSLTHKDVSRLHVEFINAPSIRGRNDNSLLDFGEKNQEHYKKIANQLGEVLGFLHKNGYVHGDLFDENILVDIKNDEPHVILHDNETANKIGKPSYKIEIRDGRICYYLPSGLDELDRRHDLFTIESLLTHIERDLFIGHIHEVFKLSYYKEFKAPKEEFRGRKVEFPVA